MLAVSRFLALVLTARHFVGGLTSADLCAIISRHGPALIGITAASAVALILVSLIRALDGPIALDMLVVKANDGGANRHHLDICVLGNDFVDPDALVSRR